MTRSQHRHRSTIARSRSLPAPARHGAAAGLVVGFALLPLAGLPVLPQGQPFLLVFGILGAALLFGRGPALVAALSASAIGGVLLLPSAGAAQADAVRGALSLVAFLMVALGLSSAVEAMRRIIAVMEAADGRRAVGALVPVQVPSRPGAMRLLAMTPAERRARFMR
jgi:hypothetical protein